jgi:DNA-binding transcriptional MerR regulator
MKLEELARAAGVAPRTVRYYVQRGLLPAPVFKGRDTEYGEEHEVRLRAIRKLQETQFLSLDRIQALFDTRPLREVERLAGAPPLGAGVVLAAPARADARAWRRIALAPGLELHVADDAEPKVKQLADTITQTAERNRR